MVHECHFAASFGLRGIVANGQGKEAGVQIKPFIIN
jgi:hypothetical protein